MVKVNLKAIPYCLSDEDIAWVEKTIAGMTDEEKVGQLFFENRGQSTDEALIELVQKYHIGGYRYNGIKKEVVQHNIRMLQENSKIPLFVACNTESGGNGSATDGTYLASGIRSARPAMSTMPMRWAALATRKPPRWATTWPLRRCATSTITGKTPRSSPALSAMTPTASPP